MNTSQPPPSGTRRTRVLVIVAVVLLLVGVALAGTRWWVKQGLVRERVKWKRSTIEQLAGLSFTNEMIRLEITKLKSDQTSELDWDWIEDHVLWMTNGEQIIYAFWHGLNNGLVEHLFLGHCSDGRWLYSSYHFCNNMAGIRGDEPPESINEFAKRYAAREFDGKSDECLKKTWPPNK